jgi:SPP1 family predicted phage head-tail adaptor
MRAGPMRHRIVIQSMTDAVGARGGITETAATFATRWARAVPLTGNERFAEGRKRATSQVRFELRHLAGVTSKMRVSWDSRLFDILVVVNAEERNRELHLLTEEVETTS